MFLGFANLYYQFIQRLSKIAELLTSMLRVVNSLENLLILINVTKTDKVMGGNRSNRTNKKLFKFQKSKNLTKWKNLIVLFNISMKNKAMEFLIFKASIAFI